MTSTRFALVRREARAAELHRFDPPADGRPTVVVAEVIDNAQVLGSTQSTEVVDEVQAELQGLTVVRRRSGGGAVRLSPGEQVWADVWIPRGDVLWLDDVRRAALPVGEAWVAALNGVGVDGLRVHDGGVVEREWSSVICFAGIGPGEVLDEQGVKWVGVSQRRTRDWIRVQTMVHRRWLVSAATAGLRLSSEEQEAVIEALEHSVGYIGDADPVPELVAALG